ncbi:hypothetical protein [Halarcobacter ebronensis]|nr:hypothetical protein [Halarcobacter ebronensis]
MLIYGFMMGIIVPLIGIVLHSSISTMVGDVILLPIYMLSSIFDEPFWYLSTLKQSLLFLICGVAFAFFVWHIEVAAKKPRG